MVREDKQLLCSPSQGRTPVPDGSGGGRRRLLPGSRGGHHRADPPLHPCSCSQHLQRHADEPQLSRPHARAAQLAAAPHQVSVVPSKPMGTGTRRHRRLPVLSGPSQNPPPPSRRTPVSENRRWSVPVKLLKLLPKDTGSSEKSGQHGGC